MMNNFSNKNSKQVKLTLFIFSIVFSQCTLIENQKLHQLFNGIEKKFDQNFLKEFKETNEKNILDYYYPDFLLDYYKKGTKESDIESFFLSKNLKSEPSQAFVFLFLLHRKLNDKAFNLKELLLLVDNKTIGLNTCNELKIINSVYNFKNLKIGENLDLVFSVRINDGIKSTIFFECPTLDWQFDKSKDLLLKGNVVNKFNKTYGGVAKEFIIKFKIREVSRKDVLYFFKNIQQNDTIDVNLNSYGLKLL